ncbi:MAG: hypothetical protein U1D30_22915 [Planctomycetota bacterium]
MSLRIWSQTLIAGFLTFGLVGCGDEPRHRLATLSDEVAPAGSEPSETTEAEGEQVALAAPKAKSGGGASGWGTIKGKIVWGGASLPAARELAVTKDQEWCGGAGPIPDETLVVDKDTKGVLNVLAYLVKPKAIHESYPQDAKGVKEADAKRFAELNGGLEFTAEAISAAISGGKAEVKNLKADALIDQIRCRYVPHAIAVREGQQLLVLNPEPIAHNVKVASVSGKNDANPNMPPGSVQVFKWVTDTSPLSLECSIHGWMKMYGMVFDHPYFAVTGKDGSFELKNVPAGDVALVLRNPKFIPVKKGGKMTARGEKITVKPGETVDLGEIVVTE